MDPELAFSIRIYRIFPVPTSSGYDIKSSNGNPLKLNLTFYSFQHLISKQILPNTPSEMIAQDLRITRSVELTIQNLLNLQASDTPPHNNLNDLNNPNNDPSSNHQNENLLSGSDQIRRLVSSVEEFDSQEQLKTKFSDEFRSTSEERQTSLRRRQEEMKAAARKQMMVKLKQQDPKSFSFPKDD